jgi:hypothetical protein
MSDIEIITTTLFDPDDIVELRFIRGKSPKVEIKKYWTTAEKLPSFADKLKAENEAGFNIYYGVNPRKAMNQSGDSNVKLARCLFCDFDNLEPGDGCGNLEFVWNDIFLAGLPEPTIAIHSGHGLHTYWRLEEPITDMSIWKATQEKLIARLGSDKTIKNPERIMRMPGFGNTKKQPFTECFICWSPINAGR